MGSRQEQFSGTREVREAHRLDEAKLAQYMHAHVEGFEGPIELRQFKGGQSNPTYQITAKSGKYVLRRKPPGKLLPSAHAVDREFRVLSALWNEGFPVPRPYALCEDDDVIGTMFYVMDCVEGRIFWEPNLPDLSPEERTAIYDQKNRTIARLHSLDYEAMGLTDYGKPGNYFARQIGRWSKQYYASETKEISDMNKLIEWLEANIPDDQSSSIVHGDYRLDNMIIRSDGPEVAAVLDWELSTIGHPLADFTYHLMTWRMPDIGVGAGGLADHDLARLGIPDEESYVRMYCERTGRDGIVNREFYSAFNFFRLAAIVQGIAGRVRDGTASNANAAKAVKAVEPLASIGYRYAQAAGG
ncbi:MAG: phosphotransferase family protein [Pseudomonadota bacterium]